MAQLLLKKQNAIFTEPSERQGGFHHLKKMENEEIKNESQNLEETGKTGILRDEKGRILPGSASLNPKGRGPETISFTTAQKRYFREHPDEFEKYCEDIRKDPSMRKIMWNYIDGMPRQNIGVEGKIIYIHIDSDIADKNNVITPSTEDSSEGQS